MAVKSAEAIRVRSSQWILSRVLLHPKAVGSWSISFHVFKQKMQLIFLDYMIACYSHVRIAEYLRLRNQPIIMKKSGFFHTCVR